MTNTEKYELAEICRVLDIHNKTGTPVNVITKGRMYERHAIDRLLSAVRTLMTSQITTDNDDFGAILTCAVRYSIGRATYMPSLVQNFIRPILHRLSTKTLLSIANDVQQAIDRNACGDEQIDKPDWVRFLADIRAEQEKRK